MSMVLPCVICLVGLIGLSTVWFFHRRQRTHLWQMVFANLPRVFISYRRQDTKDLADRLRDSLRLRHRMPSVFRDEESIAAGEDFERRIGMDISQSTIVFALIGPAWEFVERSEGAGPRFRDDDDWVKYEIESARQKGVPVIPVLVNRDLSPTIQEPPEWLIVLLKHQASKLRTATPDYDRDVAQLAAYARRDVIATSGEDERVTELARQDTLSTLPTYIVSGILIPLLSALVFAGLQVGKHLDDLKDNMSRVEEIENELIPSISAELERSQKILPVSFDEIAYYYMSDLDSQEKRKIPRESVITTEVKIKSINGDPKQIVFESINNALKGTLTLDVTGDEYAELRGRIGEDFRIVARIGGGSGGYLSGQLISWWKLIN